MMKLKDILNGQLNAAEWESKGYELPKYDIKAVREKTAKEPTWVHFGGGNIFRAFPAAILNDALNTGKYDRGVIVAETFDFEVIDKAYAPYDNLSLCVNFSEELTLSRVADEIGLNPSYLSSLFKQVTGESFKEYLNSIRIKEAQHLLSNTSYPIMQIAVSCGFSDQSYFTKVFKKCTGLTPRQYR